MKKIKLSAVLLLFMLIFLPLTACIGQVQQKVKAAPTAPAVPPPPPPPPPEPELYVDDMENYEGDMTEDEFYFDETDEYMDDSEGDRNGNQNAIKKQNQGEEKGPSDNALNRRSRVANAVQEMNSVADRIGGIGQQVRLIAQEQNQNQEQIEAGLKSAKNRGQLKKFFFGPDYKRLSTVEEKLANHEEKLAELKALAEQIENEADKASLEAQIKVMELAAVEIQNETNQAKKGFSLFGWLNRMLSK